MGQQTGEACGTGRGGCPTVRGIPLQLLLVAGLVIYTAAHGAWARANAPDEARVEAQAGAPSELLVAMAEVERPYIAALWTTANGTPTEAASSVARLTDAWAAFAAERGEALSRLEGGEVAAAWVSERIEDAGSRVAESPAAAHEVLEGVRLRLRELRVANGLDYFPDHLTAFHGPMEAMALAARSEGPGGPGPEAMAAIRAALPEAEARWAAVEAASHDNAVWGLTPEALERREALLAAEGSALDELARAVEVEDGRAVAAAGAAVKRAFAGLVLLYGAEGG